MADCEHRNISLDAELGEDLIYQYRVLCSDCSKVIDTGSTPDITWLLQEFTVKETPCD